ESYELPQINSALSPTLDVASAQPLNGNSKSSACFEGQQPGHNGFRLDVSEAKALRDAGAGAVVFPYLNGDELLSGTYKTELRYIIDFGERDIFAAQQFAPAFDLVRQRVLADWEKNARKEREKTGKQTGEHQNRLRTWWQ